MSEILKLLDRLQREGWWYKITSLEDTWWTEREGSASGFLDELKLCGTTSVKIEWALDGEFDTEDNVVALRKV
jgi:hypothetical protein